MEESKLSKYIKSESMELMRSQITLADYNPRVITEEAKKTLRRGIKKFGMVGGIIVNKQTGNRVVSGHQRIAVMDDLQKYDPEKPKTDYAIRVDVVDYDESKEKELNVLMNNPNAQGMWDYDALREIIPDIDYKAAGLTDADLSMIGVDYLYKTEEEDAISTELEEMMAQVNEEHKAEVEARAQKREEERQAIMEAQAIAQAEQHQEMTQEEKTNHMREVKQQVKEQAIQKAGDMDAYVVLSFNSLDAKTMFCKKFGYDPYSRFIKGEDFEARLEGEYEDYEE